TVESIGRTVNERLDRAVKRGVLSPLEATRERFVYEQARLATNIRGVADSIKTETGAIDYSGGAALVYKLDKEGAWNRLSLDTKSKILEGIQSRVQTQQRILEH